MTRKQEKPIGASSAVLALAPLLAALALTTLALPAPARAQDPVTGSDAASAEEGWRRGAGEGRWHRGPRMMAPGPMGGPRLHGLHRALQQLDLSEAQRDEIKTIFEGDREPVDALHEEMRLLGEQVRDQIESDPYDEESVRAKAQALAAVSVEMAVIRARQAGRVREVLTPEQLEQLDTMKELRGALREHRRERFEKRRQQKRPTR